MQKNVAMISIYFSMWQTPMIDNQMQDESWVLSTESWIWTLYNNNKQSLSPKILEKNNYGSSTKLKTRLHMQIPNT